MDCRRVVRIALYLPVQQKNCLFFAKTCISHCETEFATLGLIEHRTSSGVKRSYKENGSRHVWTPASKVLSRDSWIFPSIVIRMRSSWYLETSVARMTGRELSPRTQAIWDRTHGKTPKRRWASFVR